MDKVVLHPVQIIIKMLSMLKFMDQRLLDLRLRDVIVWRGAMVIERALCWDEGRNARPSNKLRAGAKVSSIGNGGRACGLMT